MTEQDATCNEALRKISRPKFWASGFLPDKAEGVSEEGAYRSVRDRRAHPLQRSMAENKPPKIGARRGASLRHGGALRNACAIRSVTPFPGLLGLEGCALQPVERYFVPEYLLPSMTEPVSPVS